MPDCRISLEIVEEADRRLRYHLRVNGSIIDANVWLSPEQVEAIETIQTTYKSLFAEQPPASNVVKEQLKSIGRELFQIWLEPGWQRVKPLGKGADRRLLIVASAKADILNLPWELLLVPEPLNLPLGVDTAWGICRYPLSSLPDDYFEADAGDIAVGDASLRVLFLASSPRGFPELDYEREEEFLLEAVEDNALIEIGDLGTFKELQQQIFSFRPHIVHLSGHTTYGEDGAAFVFESEAGDADLRSAHFLAGLFRGSSVRCVFVSGCGSAFSPSRDLLGGICQSLVASGVPLAVGWAAPIVDNIASAIAKTFYSTIVSDRSVAFALAHARSSVWNGGSSAASPSWSLPILFSYAADMRIRTEVGVAAPSERERASVLHKPLPGMTDGYARHLAGRRRELQASLPGLRDGRYRGMVITGIDGVGKSSLATRIVRRLEGDANKGRKPVVLRCEQNKTMRVDDLLKKVRIALPKSRQDTSLINEAGLPTRDRLLALMDDLNDSRLTLVLDAFDNNLDAATLEFLDGDIEYFYEKLLSDLVGDTRVVITARTLPKGRELPAGFLEINLGELSENAYYKFLLRDDYVRSAYSKGQLTRRTLTDLRRRFGSSPQFLEVMRDCFRSIELPKLAEELKAKSNAPMGPSGPNLAAIEEKYTKHCADVHLPEYYNRLPDQSRKVISRTAVHAGLLTADVIATIGGAPAPGKAGEEARQWRRRTLAQSEFAVRDKVWSIYGLARYWLAEPSRLDIADRRAAHRAAIDFFLATAKSLKKDMRHPELQANKLECLFAALEHCLAIADSGPDEAAQAVKVSVECNDILLEERRYDDLIVLNEELVDRLKHPEPATWVAKAYSRKSNLLAAEQWYGRALDLSSNDQTEQGHALQGLAAVAWARFKDEKTARDYLDRALTVQTAINDRKGAGVTSHQLGTIEFDLGNYDKAREKFEAALRYFEGLDAGRERQATLHQLGSIVFAKGLFAEAEQKLKDALDLAVTLGDRHAEAAAKHQHGRAVAARDKNPRSGLRELVDALTLRQAIADGPGEAQSFRRLGEMLRDAGEHDLALKLLVVSHYLYDTMGDATKNDLAIAVQRQAEELKLDNAELGKIRDNVRQDYLKDRGRQLIRKIYRFLDAANEPAAAPIQPR